MQMVGITLITTMLCSLFGGTTLLAVNKSGYIAYQENLINDLIVGEFSDINDLADLDLNDITVTADAPSHLYLTLYQNYTNDLHESALRQAAITSGYNYFTVKHVIEDNQIDGLAGEDINSKRAEAEAVNNLYIDELTITKAGAELLRDTYFFDRYANGVSTDSDFDLVNDLQTIHNLLFVGTPPTLIESNPNLIKTSVFDQLSAGDPDSNITTTTPESITAPRQNQDGADSIEPADSSENYCPADPELLAILQDYNESQSVNSSATNNGGSRPTGNQIPYAPKRLSDALRQGNSKCKEGQFFCVEIEKTYTRTQNYFPGDSSCVACQISLMNEDISNNLLSGGSLYPGRVTGLLGEAAECKEVLLNLPLDLNISLEAKPFVPEGNSAADRLLSESPEDFAPVKQPIDDLITTQQNAIGRFLARNSNSSLVDITENKRSLDSEIKSRQQTYNLAADASNDPATASGFTQELVPKMRQFNAYLDSFSRQISDIGLIIEEMAQKKSCS